MAGGGTGDDSHNPKIAKKSMFWEVHHTICNYLNAVSQYGEYTYIYIYINLIIYVSQILQYFVYVYVCIYIYRDMQRVFFPCQVSLLKAERWSCSPRHFLLSALPTLQMPAFSVKFRCPNSRWNWTPNGNPVENLLRLAVFFGVTMNSRNPRIRRT